MTAQSEDRDRTPARLFLAFDLPRAHREEIRNRSATVKKELPAARWVPAENLHLTLAFLGDVPTDRIDELIGALRPAFARTPAEEPFLELAAAGGGTFPPNRPARVAWVGIEGPPELTAVQRRVERAAMRALDREPRRKPFHPHVTVARPRRPWNRRATERFAAAFEGRLGEPFVVERGVLYRSQLKPGGSVYAALQRFPLAEGRT